MRILADRSVCIGAGQCVFTDPDAFDQEDSGTVLVLRPRPDGEAELELARQAVQVCPSRALALVDDDDDQA